MFGIFTKKTDNRSLKGGNAQGAQIALAAAGGTALGKYGPGIMKKGQKMIKGRGKNRRPHTSNR